MQTADYPEVPDDFGHWLAGFIDGEGCFYIDRRSDATYMCVLRIGLRDDDRAALELIARETGLGRVRASATPASIAAGSKPQVEWKISSKHECRRMVDILDAHPLRAKKARDYAIWRQATLIWVGVRARNEGRLGSGPRDWSRMALLHRQLKAIRAYDPPPSLAEPEHPSTLWEN